MARAQAERDRLRPTDRHGSPLPPYRSRSLRKRRRRRRRTEPTPPPPLALTRSLSLVALSDIHAVSRYSLYSSSSSDSPSGSSLPTHKGEKEEEERGRTLRGIAERKDGREEERGSKRQIGLLSFSLD